MIQKLADLFYVHTGLYLAVFCLIGAAVEMACGLSLGGFWLTYIAAPAAGLMTCGALVIVWGVYRFERRYA
jgi:hypothetical protein